MTHFNLIINSLLLKLLCLKGDAAPATKPPPTKSLVQDKSREFEAATIKRVMGSSGCTNETRAREVSNTNLYQHTFDTIDIHVGVKFSSKVAHICRPERLFSMRSYFCYEGHLLKPRMSL
jgi:hypothetical protein